MFPSEPLWPLKKQRGTSASEAQGPKILAFCAYKLIIAKHYEISCKINYLESLFYFFDCLEQKDRPSTAPRRPFSAAGGAPSLCVLEASKLLPKERQGHRGWSWVTPWQQTPLGAVVPPAPGRWDVWLHSKENKTGCAEPRSAGWTRAAGAVVDFLQREPQGFKSWSVERGAAWGKPGLGLSEMFCEVCVLLDFGKRDLDLARGFKSGKCETSATAVSKPETGGQGLRVFCLQTLARGRLSFFNFNWHQEDL